jgi:hypothetical protein
MPQREQRTDAPAAAAVDELPAHSTFDEAKFNPNPVLLQLAKEPASATLPRQQRQRAPSKVGRARIPLQSSLVGAGRAGTVTTLTGSCGSRYHGQVLAGRPHGRGQLWLPVRVCVGGWVGDGQRGSSVLPLCLAMDTACLCKRATAPNTHTLSRAAGPSAGAAAAAGI